MKEEKKCRRCNEKDFIHTLGTMIGMFIFLAVVFKTEGIYVGSLLFGVAIGILGLFVFAYGSRFYEDNFK